MKLSSEWLIALVAPHTCLGCGEEGEVCCAACRDSFLLPLPTRCYRCRRLTKEYAGCEPCRSRLRHVWVSTEYTGLARELLHHYKYERMQAAAGVLAERMADALPYLPRDTVVTFVPTATKRMRIRGYDHAQLIAEAVATQLGLPCCRLATRLTQTRQVGSSRAKRLRQLRGAFLVTGPSPKRVLLVDDVVTTGATLEAVAALLRKAGARHVDGVVFAQKL